MNPALLKKQLPNDKKKSGMKKRSLTVFELLVAICIIFIFIGTFAVYALNTLKAAREIALQSELRNIRMSIEHYRITTGEFPRDLSELTKQLLTGYSSDSTITVQQFLKPFRLDKEGFLLDPFFNRYSYNKACGIVYSETKRYRQW